MRTEIECCKPPSSNRDVSDVPRRVRTFYLLQGSMLDYLPPFDIFRLSFVEKTPWRLIRSCGAKSLLGLKDSSFLGSLGLLPKAKPWSGFVLGLESPWSILCLSDGRNPDLLNFIGETPTFDLISVKNRVFLPFTKTSQKACFLHIPKSRVFPGLNPRCQLKREALVCCAFPVIRDQRSVVVFLEKCVSCPATQHLRPSCSISNSSSCFLIQS